MKPKQAWYKEPLVWLIVAIPLSAVVAGITMLSLAIISNDGLVVDDYYARGKEINQILNRDRRAMDAGLRASVELNYDKHELNVSLGSEAQIEVPDSIDFQFIHPVMAGQDHRVRLQQTSARTFQGSLPELTPGRWTVQLGTMKWRLLGSIRIPERGTLVLRADPPTLQ
ncbi:MAG: FixH family protein [Gammaproteobacteria bacterium]|nr:FixH family protein [Gammaproteobacteria bacterium]